MPPERASAEWPFLSLLSQEQRRFLRSRAMERAYTGETLVQDANSESLGAVLVTEGRLRMYLMGCEGREVTLGYSEAGDCLILGPAPQPSGLTLGLTVETECESRLTVLSTPAMDYLMTHNAALTAWCYRWVCAVGGHMLRAMQQALYMGVDQRVAHSLLEQCAWRKSRSLMITQERLAHQASTSREVVTRTLKVFSHAGLIRTGRGQIEVLDERGLAAVAEGRAKRGDAP